MAKDEFFTTTTRARAVPVDVKLFNHTWVQENVLVPLTERREVDLSMMKVSENMLRQDLNNMLGGDLAVPDLAHSPGESVESVHAEGSSAKDEDLPSSDEGKGVEDRAQEGEGDAEGKDGPDVVNNTVEKQDEGEQ